MTVGNANETLLTSIEVVASAATPVIVSDMPVYRGAKDSGRTGN